MVKTYEVHISTSGTGDVVDITEKLQGFVEQSGLKDGICVVIVPGSTGAITTIEYEPGAVKDLVSALDRIAPQDAYYHHNETWGDGNGFSHLRSALLGTSFSVPFVGGELVLGTWQQVVFVECDKRARHRRLVVQLVGE